MLTNIRTTRIDWCECDPAGIIYYPRYFQIFDTCTTVLIERALGMNKIDFLKVYNFLGYPVLDTRVSKPSKRSRYRRRSWHGLRPPAERGAAVFCHEKAAKRAAILRRGGVEAVGTAEYSPRNECESANEKIADRSHLGDVDCRQLRRRGRFGHRRRG